MQDVVKGRNPKHEKNQKGMDGILATIMQIHSLLQSPPLNLATAEIHKRFSLIWPLFKLGISVLIASLELVRRNQWTWVLSAY